MNMRSVAFRFYRLPYRRAASERVGRYGGGAGEGG